MAKEKFAQLAFIDVTESANNTLTFDGLSVFSNVLSQQGMILHRAEYSFSVGDFANILADYDQVVYGLAGSDSLTTIKNSDPEVYDYNDTTYLEQGTPTSFLYYQQPKIKDFNDLPGGGLLVPADRLFAYVKGVSATGTFDLTVRVWFTLMDMSPADYLELAQAMRVLK